MKLQGGTCLTWLFLLWLTNDVASNSSEKQGNAKIQFETCNTPTCKALGNRFLQTLALNNETPPCSNFYKYVCKKLDEAKDPAEYRELKHHVDIRKILYGLLTSRLVHRGEDMNATDMVKAAYRSCLGHYGYYEGEPAAIGRVLKEHGIEDWPSMKKFRSYLDVLKITGLEPLFHIEVTRTKQNFPTNIIQLTTASSYALPWTEWPNNGIGKRRAMAIETEYKYLIKNIILLLNNNAQNLETTARSIISMEKAMAKVSCLSF